MELAFSADAAPALAARTRRRNPVALLVGVLDVAVIIVAIVLAIVFRFGGIAADVSGFGALDYSLFSVCLGLVWSGALHLAGTYRREIFGVGAEEFRAMWRATFWAFGAVAIVALLAKMSIARGYLAIAFPLGLVLLLAERALMRRWLVRRRAIGDFCERTLIVGTRVEVRYAADAIARNPSAGYQTTLVSVVNSADERFELADGTVVENIGLVDNVATLDGVVDTVIVAGQSAVSPSALRNIGWQLEGTQIGLALASSMTDVAGPRIHRRPVEGLPLMGVESPTYSGGKFLVKRALDIVLSGAALIVLSPIFVVVSVLIYLEDRGPVLFRQVRVGVGGRHFRMTKFRSMVVDAERLRDDLVPDDTSSVLFKMRDDPRITKVGKFIRAYSIDELPQLLDVLVGHMSLVGPRPPLPSEVSQYESHVRRRLNVKPGITGPWQVGGRSNLTWAASVQKDLYYVENWSVMGDLAILARTVQAVLKRDGAH
ncbi:sugar transferase [Flexivirga caeni]|uniref:Sugar transferase n=1 Tax=Flexivirga caeni TaxID=2294115 RepID=A0A3M9M5S5_9MICO|nr:sugar transferase [Flexivirga caeni]RNI20924.1 sugar transferase [Flexivirga caeni]